VQKGLGREKPLVLEQGDLEGNFVHAVSLLGSLDFDETFSLKGSELVLDFGILCWGRSEIGEILETFLLSSYFVSLVLTCLVLYPKS
jgi:hypothetical protein